VNPVTDFCFKNTPYLLTANIPGGVFSGNGVSGNQFNPYLAGSGSHTLTYTLVSGACTAATTVNVSVIDTLKVRVNPPIDTICPGEIVWLRASATGGDKFSYSFAWSNGQTGNGTFVSPLTTTVYNVVVTDGCSEPATAAVPIYRHSKPYFMATTSPPVCFGQKGWVKLRMKDVGPYRFTWDVSPAYIGDSLNALSGNQYRVTAVNLKTGCIVDTTIEIPGYKAITAAFIGSIPNGAACLSPIYPNLRIFNNCVGAETGTWFWGDGSSEPFDPGMSPKHFYNGEKNRYRVKLLVQNAGGCTDSAEADYCYRDTVVYYIPNAFTPNNDGFNDKLESVVIGATEFEMLIYNRWGQIVFKSDNTSQFWDGTYRGTHCPEGVYAYRIKFKGRKTPNRQDKGSILLLRPKN
jgi:gliding motility-associated-like protein